MRLWHYKMIQFLPKSQLLAQWRELNSIFKKQDKHILINYVYEYPKLDLYHYTEIVIDEMKKRGYKINDKSTKNANNYFIVVNYFICIQLLRFLFYFINFIRLTISLWYILSLNIKQNKNIFIKMLI